MFTSILYYVAEFTCVGRADHTLSSGTKRTLLFNPPAVLTIHFKRFQQVYAVKSFRFLHCNLYDRLVRAE